MFGDLNKDSATTAGQPEEKQTGFLARLSRKRNDKPTDNVERSPALTSKTFDTFAEKLFGSLQKLKDVRDDISLIEREHIEMPASDNVTRAEHKEGEDSGGETAGIPFAAILKRLKAVFGKFLKFTKSIGSFLSKGAKLVAKTFIRGLKTLGAFLKMALSKLGKGAAGLSKGKLGGKLGLIVGGAALLGEGYALFGEHNKDKPVVQQQEHPEEINIPLPPKQQSIEPPVETGAPVRSEEPAQQESPSSIKPVETGAPVRSEEPAQQESPSSIKPEENPQPQKQAAPVKKLESPSKPSASSSSKDGTDKETKDIIKRHEGVRYRPYKDSLGLWTVGVGHLIGDGRSLPPEMNREFTPQEVDTMFEQDYSKHANAAERIPGYDKMNKNGKTGLIDLTFNMGPKWYTSWPNFTKQIAAGDTGAASQNLRGSKWFTQVGERGPDDVALIESGGSSSGTLVASKDVPNDAVQSLASAGDVEVAPGQTYIQPIIVEHRLV